MSVVKKNPKDVLPENEVVEENYVLPKTSKTKIILIALLVITTGFVLNFPFREKIQELVRKELSAIPNCPIHYESMRLEFFMPKISILKAAIPGSCLKQNFDRLGISSLSIRMTGIGLSPLGLRTLVEMKIDESKVEMSQMLSTSRQDLHLQNTRLHLDSLLPLFTESIRLAGDLEVTSEVSIFNQKIEEAKVQITSRNFQIPPQSIAGYNLPTQLNESTLQLSGRLDSSNKFRLQTFVLGNESAPIRASLAGVVIVNSSEFGKSTLDLSGEISFTDAFLALPGNGFLSMLLSNYDKKNGFYQIKIGGTLSEPKPAAQ